MPVVRPLLLALALAAAVGPSRSAVGQLSSDRFVSPEELTEVIASGNVDAVIETLNAVNSMRYLGEILPLVLDIWEEDRAARPALRWDVAASEAVRVTSALVLVLAHRNGRIEIDLQQVRTAMIAKIGQLGYVERTALQALGYIGDPRDVPLLVAVAQTGQRNRLLPAISALESICAPEALRSLRDLEATLADPELRSYVSDLLADINAGRSARRFWCR